MDEFPRLTKLMSVLKYLENHPYTNLDEICQVCDLSQATFFQLKNVVFELGVVIEFETIFPFLPSKKRAGYRIVEYGAINKQYLKGVKL